MAARSSKGGRTTRGIYLGMAATLIVVAAHWTSFGLMAEVRWLDLCFEHLPTLPPSGQVVHVDLDDKALEHIGRWPWPRRKLAQLTEVLSDCGARAIALDIILPDPQEPRYVKEGATDLYSAETGAILSGSLPPVMVLDDVELAEALSVSPNLFLAMHVDITRLEPERTRREQLINVLAGMATTRPAVTRGQAAEELGLSLEEIAPLMSTAKEQAFEQRTRALFRAEADQPLAEVMSRLLGQAEPGSEDADIARRTYLRQRALHVMQRFALPAQALEDASLPAGRAVPPLVTLARVIAHTGFVTVDPDQDGIVRRTPLLVRTEEGVFPHMALALAGEALAAEHGGKHSFSASGRHVVITCADGFVRNIPVDAEGYMRINWAKGAGGQEGLRHISAVAVADVWEARERLQRNRNLFRQGCLRIVEMLGRPDEGAEGFGELIGLVGEADRLWQQRQQRQLQRQKAMLFFPASAPPPATDLLAREQQIERQIDRACRKLLEEVDSFYLPTAGQPASAGRETAQLRELRQLRAFLRRIDQENKQLRRGQQEATDRLAKEVLGKICLVGSTSTGAADFVPTPVHRRTPGVVVHSNILETILSGKFVREPHPWVSGLLILLAGALVALIASTRGPIELSILLVAGMVAYALIDTGVWVAWTYWVVAAGPVAAMLMSFGVITVYRQLTEVRQRRQITKTFKQYLSPTMVDQLVEDPTQAGLGGQRRELSCLFSDLAGFTSISERLGPEGTVNLLNRYLDRVGEVVQVRFGGTLSKYEGDGVFAFFGAPIPQADHAARALRAALGCQAFLAEFNRACQVEKLLPPEMRLSARIGITAGEVFVGNMGSTQRVAYTAIGDSVNLASRLETANKFFGTRILANEQAWQAGLEGLVGRPMGRVLVVGKTEPVAVWEPLAHDGKAADALHELAEQFARGVQLYAAGDFQAARDCFRQAAEQHDDPAARVYLRLCEDALAWPGGAKHFDGVIRLAEK